MNAPAPFADAATWQRLCATRSVKDARFGLGRAIPWFIFIWGVLILCASLISGIAIQSHSFDPTQGTLMTFLISMLATGNILHLFLLFLFILGLFSAMITTADSLLLVSAQMFTQDLCRIHPEPDPARDVRGLRVARSSLILIALLSFSLFVVFQWIKFDVVQLIFAIYGAHIALFPSVIAALFFKGRLQIKKAAPAAWLSTAAGFLAGWESALYGKHTGQMNWLYNAPAFALLASIATFLLFSLPAWKRVTRE
jgi:Na+/proline symporter